MKFKGRRIVTYDNCKIGDLVVRGRDWRWGDQDIYEGKQMVGRIIDILKNSKWVRVEWGKQELGIQSDAYRVGEVEEKNIYDFLLFELSYFINKFDDILKIYALSDSDSYQIFDHSSTIVSDNIVINLTKFGTLNRTLEQIHPEITRFRGKYMKKSYETFIKKRKPEKEAVIGVIHSPTILSR